MSNFEGVFGFGRNVEEMQRNIDRLKGIGGDGTSGDVTDDWKASVDRQLGQLQADLRGMFKSGAAAVVVLAGMIAGLYFYVNDKVDHINARLTAIEVQQARSDAVVDGKLDILLDRKEAKQR